jgi:hypothetical protein
MKITAYLNPRKSNARRMLEAFAAGFRADIVTSASGLEEGACAFYGVDEETRPLFDRCVAEGRDFFYIDNGYFRSKYTGGDFYRITRNAAQHTGLGPSDGRRWAELGLEIQPWRTEGRTVLVALQSPWWYERHGTTVQEWTRGVLSQLAEMRYNGSEELEVVVRSKPTKAERPGPLDFRDVYCVVTHSSNVAVDGLLAGIPCSVAGPCAARTMGGKFPDRVEVRRFLPDPARLRWAEVLADNQWSLAEIADGTAARMLGVRDA